MADYMLIALGVFLLIATNYTLMSAGWPEEFEKEYNSVGYRKPTGVFICDLLVEFFNQLLNTEFGSIVTYQIFAFALPASTMVLYEGSRRKDSFSSIALCLYSFLSQFIGVAAMTPIFLSFFKEYDPKATVGSYRVIINILNAIITAAIFLHLIFQDQPTFDKYKANTIVLFLLVPVLIWSLSLAIDFKGVHKKEASLHWLVLPYLISIPLGLALHFHLLLALVNNPSGLYNAILTHPPTAFLSIDCIGLMLSCFLWFLKYADKKSKMAFNSLPLVAVVGPTTVFSALCMDRERSLYQQRRQKRR